MQELAAENSKTTYKGKSNSYKKNIQNTNLLQTSQADLTSKEKDLFPYWNEQLKEKSEKLWLPIETDLLALDLSLSSGLLQNMGETFTFRFEAEREKQFSRSGQL